MKYRIGFISNSSSTSFAICGYHIDETDFPRIIELYDGGVEKVSIRNAPDSDYYYIGLDISCMENNETKQQFCDRAEEAVLSVFPELKDKNIKPDFIYDGWYDG